MCLGGDRKLVATQYFRKGDMLYETSSKIGTLDKYILRARDADTCSDSVVVTSEYIIDLSISEETGLEKKLTEFGNKVMPLSDSQGDHNSGIKKTPKLASHCQLRTFDSFLNHSCDANVVSRDIYYHKQI